MLALGEKLKFKSGGGKGDVFHGPTVSNPAVAGLLVVITD